LGREQQHELHEPLLLPLSSCARSRCCCPYRPLRKATAGSQRHLTGP